MTLTDAPDVRYAASKDLVAATRELMLAVGTTDLDTAELADAADELRAIAARLGERRRTRVTRTGFQGPQQAREQGVLWQSFVHNPMAIPLEILFEGDTARATFRPHALHEGPADSLHGGFSAHLMDSLLGTMMQARGARALTATLDVRYLRQVPLDQELELHAEVTNVSGRKHIATGWISHDGHKCVEARGLFVEVPHGGAPR